MTPIVRIATPADIEVFSPMHNKPSIRALCMELDGRVIALGGVAWSRGRWIAFADLPDEARQFRMHILRTAVRFFDQARRDGIRYIYALADGEERRAVAWLTWLGFVPDRKFHTLYRWEA